jgi:fructose-bisphosphate aldolase, class I
MTSSDLEATAQALVADGRGILAADETVPTLSKRLDARGIRSTAESRQAYREMLFSTPGIAELVSGVILQDETIHQRSTKGRPLAHLLSREGILPGIKVDYGAKPLAPAASETVTEGLDGLRQRLDHYRELGARFAKWRAMLRVADGLPTPAALQANAHALARYAALCQEQGLVPIAECEVLMDGSHTLERCQEVTERALHAVFDALFDQGVALEGLLLKPNMVVPGHTCPRPASVEGVATATLRCLRRHVPPAVPGIVFLSGGQTHVAATEHLNAINGLEGPKPWKLTFSFGRALQDEALVAWGGREENLEKGQRAFHHRAKCVSAAALGTYTSAMEGALVEA